MKTTDERQKALVLFNFAGLDKRQLEYVKVVVSNKYPKHQIFTDGKTWRKNRYLYNYFICTVENSIKGIDVLTSTSSGTKIVLRIQQKDLPLPLS